MGVLEAAPEGLAEPLLPLLPAHPCCPSLGPETLKMAWHPGRALYCPLIVLKGAAWGQIPSPLAEVRALVCKVGIV